MLDISFYFTNQFKLKKSSSNKKVMSKNVSKFARPVFLRPVFRPTFSGVHMWL